jgi:hypothetical protein
MVETLLVFQHLLLMAAPTLLHKVSHPSIFKFQVDIGPGKILLAQSWLRLEMV